MVLGNLFTQFIDRSSVTTKKGLPLLNTTIATYPSVNRISSNLLSTRKKRLINRYKNVNAILTGIVNKVVKDINETVYFEPVSGKEDREKVESAKKFYVDNYMRSMFSSQLVDALVPGEAYAFMEDVPQAKLKEQVDAYLQTKGFPINDFTRRIAMKANFPDESDLLHRKIKYIASSTMENVYDKHEIKKFVQRVAQQEVEFTKDEIIHIKMMEVDGQPQGFTPVWALLDLLELDEFMWDNMGAMAQNGGQPDKVFSIEDIDINSPAFKRIERELKKYQNWKNRHGTLLLNGKVAINELQQIDNLQFKELGLYIAGIVALQWSVPRSRLPFIVGGTNTKEDTGGNSEKDYFSNIEMMQDLFAQYYNMQHWIPKFGVRMCFTKAYKQDSVQESQVMQTRLGNLALINNALAKNSKMLNEKYVIRYFNGVNETIRDEDLAELPEEELMMPGDPANKKVLSDQDLNSNSDKKNVQDEKRDEQKRTEAQRGKDTGAGKEITNKEILIKEIGSKERMKVPFRNFLKLYNEDKAFNREPPRVFLSEGSDNIFRFVYKSTDFIYETFLPRHDFTTTKFLNFIKLIQLGPEEMSEVLGIETEEQETDEIKK